MIKLDKYEWLFASLVIIICAVMAYGVLASQLGFYWDDWPMVWLVDTERTASLYPYQAGDRPVHSYLYEFGFNTFGTYPPGWHIAGLFIRISSGLVLLAGLRKLWPERRLGTLMIALFTVIYPGFSQQPNAQIYFVNLSTVLAMMLSFTFTVYAIKSDNRLSSIVYSVIAMVTGLLYVVLFEYFLGLELLRLLLIWYMSQDVSDRPLSRERILSTIKRGAPYLVIALAFFIWRTFIFSATREETNVSISIIGRFQENPIRALVMPIDMFKDFLDTVLFAWFAPLHNMLTTDEPSSLVRLAPLAISMAFVLVTIGIIVAYRNIFRSQSQHTDEMDRRWAVRLIIAGIIAFPAALILVHVSGHSVTLADTSDRYTLPTLIPVAIIIVGSVYLITNVKLRVWVLAFLAGISVCTQFLNTSFYADEYARIKEMWWQAAWRMPQVEQGTMLVIDDIDQAINYNFTGRDYNIYGAANLIYQYDSNMDFVKGSYLDDKVVNRMQAGTIILRSFHHIDFTDDYNNSLIVVRQDNACVRVIDNERLELPTGASSDLVIASDFSQVGRIMTEAEPAMPSESIFGAEPAHGWCYYFEKADLARQMGEYEQVVELFNQAQNQNLSPNNATELYPFIESYIVLGKIDDAQTLVDQALADSKLINPEANYKVSTSICAMLNRLEATETFSSIRCS